MDISVPPEVSELAQRTREFVAEVVIGVEEETGGSIHAAPDELRRSLQKQAREAGLLAPHVPVEWGGCGLDVRGQAVVFEEAGYSLLGPLALNCAAPDEGNMHLLSVVGSREQKEKYLGPLAAGEIRSCFAMTEPAPGAGADPSMLATTATRVTDGWRIDGRKWFISGAHGAGFAICMARTSGAPGERGGATMFLVDADNPGMSVVRDIETLDEGLFGGHSEVVFDGCVVGPSSVLGEVDRGFEYAQVRLAPARGAPFQGGRGPGGGCRLRDRHGGQPGAHLAHRCRAGRRGPGRDRIVRRQDVRGRGGQPGGGPLGADLRGARRLRGRAAVPLPARGTPVPDLRRAVRGAPLGDRPAGHQPAPARHRGRRAAAFPPGGFM